MRNAIRSYMNLAQDDVVDLAVMSAIISNFAPDRVNPLWFVLIASSEAGKSMLLDVILGGGWKPVFPLANAISGAYFFSARTEHGALHRIQSEGKRLLYMRDMAALTSLPQISKQAIHNQLIGIYDGEYRHETGLTSKTQLYTAAPAERLGWIGAATERFYDAFLMRTSAVGSRFTAYYWQDPRPHWTDHAHLEMQRTLRDRRIRVERETRDTVQHFLDEAIAKIADFRKVEISPAQGSRMDAATTLAMRIVGTGRTTPRGGRTADRATQFARAAAFLSGQKEVEPEHGDMGVRLVLSQLPVEYQQLVGYSIRPENVGTFWTFADFLKEVGGRRAQYSEYRRGGPLENLVDVGVLQPKGGSKGWAGSTKFTMSRDALRLVEKFDPRCAELRRQRAQDEPKTEVEGADDPAEVSLEQLNALEEGR